VLDADAARQFFAGDVLVEEKLDGANVALWLDDDSIVQVATRGGAAAQDRAGQRGPLRRWAAEHSDALRALLDGGWALYGEWLWRSHGVRYSRLPDWLVGLDLWHPELQWAKIEERDERLMRGGVGVPPRLADWTHLKGADEVHRLIALTAYGESVGEGAIVRRRDGLEPRLAKVVSTDFARPGDDHWRRGERNALAR